MWFAILGPLLVHDGERPVVVPKGRQRALLAALLLHAGSPVPADALAEVVWGGSPPSGADITLRSYVLRLRRALGPLAGTRVVTCYPGYLLRVGEDEVDLLRFRCLCQEGGAAARTGAWERADTLLGEALGLWRGTPLGDIPSESLRTDECPGLEELRLQAEEWRIDAALHLGKDAELVPRLRSLVARDPLRENFRGQLMVTLYRCGRLPEALAAYQDARDVLIAELGVEPGRGLRELHQRILSADPALAAGLARPVAAQPARTAPRELPPAVPGFTGRSAELTALTGLLDRSRGQAVVISAIGGTAGVGKTALAVHWAHQADRHFPDGQLYVNLRGHDPGQPMLATDALAGFLRSLGVPVQDIPPEAGERTARYRSLLAGKRMLVLLDNAGSADQVRPLLPGTQECTVLVTSRDTLAGLIARDGAARLDLDVLPLQEAVALLRVLVGARVDTDPGAATGLATQCCRLPLALRVAAELAASRPATPLAVLTNELSDLRTRLDLLDADGDSSTEVRAVFSWSYRHLDSDPARTFRLLGLHPGSDTESRAVAALTGATEPRARGALETLASAHLLQPTSSGRYGMHDLLRAYARELSVTVDTGQDQRTALTRLFDHYLRTAAAAMDTLFPAEQHRRPAVPLPTVPEPSVGDPAAARDWLDRERATLVAISRHTVDHGWPGHTIRLAATVSSYLRYGGHLIEALSIFSHALDAAGRTGDRVAEAAILNDIGLVDWHLSRFQEAADHHGRALALFRAAGDRAGEARALGNMGLTETELGRYDDAARHQHEAVAIHRDIGDRLGEARALGFLGLARQRQGRYQDAGDCHQQSLDRFREIGDSDGEAYALARLGAVDLHLGRYEPAAGYLGQALSLFRDIGSTVGESEALRELGDVYLELGGYQQAADNFEQALVISRKIGDPIREAGALNGLGEVFSRTGESAQARAHHTTALRLASDAGSPREQARAHNGLARAYQAAGDTIQAQHHWQEALSGYTAIGAPEADEIRAQRES